MDFFGKKKKVKNYNISKTERHIEKKCKSFVGGQMWKIIKKLQPSILKFVEEIGFKNTEKSSFSMNPKFSMPSSKQTARRKICLYSRVRPFVKVWGTLLNKQKKNKKNLAAGWIFLDFF